jgi:RHS repeat-associated protein
MANWSKRQRNAARIASEPSCRQTPGVRSRLAILIAVALAVALPVAMLPSSVARAAIAPQVASASKKSPATKKAPAKATETASTVTLPTAPGGQAGTGEGALGSAGVPSPTGASTSSPIATTSGDPDSDAIVGSPAQTLVPGMLNVPNTTQPNSTDRSSSVFDSSKDQVVNFGGCTSGVSSSCTAWSNKTWTFNGTNWILTSPATSPSARTNQVMAYDPSSNTTVMFGGENGSGALSDTWVWNGTTWTQSTGSTHPSARFGAQMAYLPSTGLVYLFGGQSGSTYLSDTWSWNGTTWTQLTPSTSPSARSLGMLAYAGTLGTSANDLILYGGTNSSGDLGDTWLFNGTTWSEPTLTAGPGPLEQGAMSYDPTMSVPLLYGGEDAGTVSNLIWAWTGSQWEEGLGPYTVALYGIAMAEDPTNGQLVVSGGQYSSSSANLETFKIDYLNSQPRSGTLFSTNLDDRLTQSVNPTSTDLMLSQTDINLAGIGLPLNLSQNFDYEGGCVSQYFGCLWSAGILDTVAYQQPDGHSVVLHMPDGSLTLCPWNGTTWVCPAGSDLSYNGSAIVEEHNQITLNLNSNHEIASAVDRNGNTITFHYSGGLQVTSITDTEGRTTTLSYSSGVLHQITDPSGRTVTFSYYTGNTDLSSYALSDGTSTETTSFADLGFGDPFDLTTPAGREIRYQTGSLNRLSSVTRVTNTMTGAGSETQYSSYSNNGQVVATDPNGNATTYSLNSSGNQVSGSTDPLGHTQSSTYDPNSNPETLTNALTQVTTLAWDTNNNLNQITSNPTASGQTAANTYYSFATPTTGSGAVTGGQYLASSSEDAQGNCSSFTYDANGNQTATYSGLTPTSGTTNCDGKTTGTGVTSVVNAYQGDGTTTCGAKPGELCTTTSGAGNVTSYGYNSLGQVTSITQPGGSCVSGSRNLCTTIAYDSLGRVQKVTDGRGDLTTYSYDLADRITQILYSGDSSCVFTDHMCVQYSYDADGNVLTREDTTGTTTFVYDTLGRLGKEELPSGANACSGSSPAGITFTYDAASNLTQYCDAGGAVTYAYDPAERNVGTATGSGSCTPGSIVQPCTVYGYNNANELTGISYPTSTGVAATLGYDGAGDQTSAKVAKGTTNLENLSYTYWVGTADQELQHTVDNLTSGVTTTYSYDNRNRLTGANTGTPSTSDSYGYDADGNLTTQDLGGTTTTQTYSASDALCWAVAGTSSNACASPPTGATTYSYDADGNQTGNSAGLLITYNPYGQTNKVNPVGGTSTSMAYTGTDSTQRTIAGSADFTNSIFGVASSTTGSTTTYFTWDPSGRLNSVLVGGNRYYVYYDGSGSVAGMFNSSGSSVATYAYDPYGNTTSSGSEAAANPFRFKGGYADTTGYYKFGTRYYSPTLGSWTQQDPIAGTVQNPSAVNRYPYAGDNPVNFIDPSGASFFGAIGNFIQNTVLGGSKCVHQGVGGAIAGGVGGAQTGTLPGVAIGAGLGFIGLDLACQLGF